MENGKMEKGKMENGFSVVDPLVEIGCRRSAETDGQTGPLSLKASELQYSLPIHSHLRWRFLY